VRFVGKWKITLPGRCCRSFAPAPLPPSPRAPQDEGGRFVSATLQSVALLSFFPLLCVLCILNEIRYKRKEEELERTRKRNTRVLLSWCTSRRKTK
jgi:hypothetical protein